MKTKSMFVILFSLIAITAFAQPPSAVAKPGDLPDLPMIRSTDALRTYAIEQTANVSASINTSLPSDARSWDYVSVQEATADGIGNTIRGMSLSVDVVNPNDYLFVWAGSYNADGDVMFSGWKQFRLVAGKGGYALPADYGDITLSLVDNVPLRINGAQSASIVVLDDNGQTTMGTSLQVRDGKVYFPRQLAGMNAILAVYTGKEGNGWLYWNVSNGSQTTPERFNITLKSIVKGVVSVTDLANVEVAVPTTNHVGNNITVEYKSTDKGLVGASFFTTEGKWFLGAWVRKAGTSDWVPYKAAIGGGSVFINIPMQPGTYYIVPAWNDGDLIEPADPWYPPYDGGGKG